MNIINIEHISKIFGIKLFFRMLPVESRGETKSELSESMEPERLHF